MVVLHSIITVPLQAPGSSPLRKEMAGIMEFVTKMTLPGQQNPDSDTQGNIVVMNVLCSIARTNLELEVVQHGGNLLQTPVTTTGEETLLKVI